MGTFLEWEPSRNGDSFCTDPDGTRAGNRYEPTQLNY